MFLNRLNNIYRIMQHKMIQTREECLNCLKELELPFKLYEHKAVFNMEEMSAELKLEHAPFIKSLFFADKKPNIYYLIIALMDTKPQKAFWKNFGTTNNNVRMAKPQAVESVLKSKKGAVNPFCLANDPEHTVKSLIIDDKLYEHQYWAFHPMDNTATIQLRREDFFKFLTHFKINSQKTDLLQQVVVEEKKEQKKEQKKDDKKGKTLLALQAKKDEDFSGWYQDVIVKSGMIDYYDVSGCYILRPWAFGIWERIQTFLDKLFKENGTQNAYFPMFVSKKALELEKDHVQGFAPEVAWVTKSGQSDLHEPIAIRPTSETIMYPAYANWIQSHRDLPLKLNQWSNVVRWEFKHPTPFIRTREFLWQEGHTAHISKEEADVEMYTNQEFYRRTYEQLLAIPVMKGVKTQSQRFPGGITTSTIETWIYENGRSVQSATSHNLGQNFAKMFEICFEGEKKEKKYVWQTSWGLSTRSIGVMVMIHGDNKGLVLPPRVANIQVVVVPIPKKGKEEMVYEEGRKLFKSLKDSGLRVHLDERDNYTSGWKFNHWEIKGVPIILELGLEEIEKKIVTVAIRHSFQKIQVHFDNLNKQLQEILQKIQSDMYLKAKARFESKIKQALNWQDFMKHLNTTNVIYTPWCDELQCEEQVKEKSGNETKENPLEGGENKMTGQAKTLCIPLQAEEIKEEKCFHCQKAAKTWVYWGRSY